MSTSEPTGREKKPPNNEAAQSGIAHTSPGPEGQDSASQLPSTPEPGDNADAEEIEEDLTRTREQLGQTVEELTERLDPRAQVRHRADDVKHRADDIKHNVVEHLSEAQTQAAHYTEKAKHAAEEVRHDPAKVAAGGVLPVVAVIAGIAVGIFVYRRIRD